MTIPDYISPLVGWKDWGSTKEGELFSPIQRTCVWTPNKAVKAECQCYPFSIGALGDGEHKCGIYACKTWPLLQDRGYQKSKLNVVGEVLLWGTIHTHEDGYRAEYAYPKSLFIIPDNEPFHIKEMESRIRNLASYKVDVGIVYQQEFLPLMDKHFHWQKKGLDALLHHRTEWYSGKLLIREEERTKKPKVGDKVFFAGQIYRVKRNENHSSILIQPPIRTVVVSHNRIMWDKRLNAYIVEKEKA